MQEVAALKAKVDVVWAEREASKGRPTGTATTTTSPTTTSTTSTTGSTTATTTSTHAGKPKLPCRLTVREVKLSGVSDRGFEVAAKCTARVTSARLAFKAPSGASKKYKERAYGNTMEIGKTYTLFTQKVKDFVGFVFVFSGSAGGVKGSVSAPLAMPIVPARPVVQPTPIPSGTSRRRYSPPSGSRRRLF